VSKFITFSPHSTQQEPMPEQDSSQINSFAPYQPMPPDIAFSPADFQSQQYTAPTMTANSQRRPSEKSSQ